MLSGISVILYLISCLWYIAAILRNQTKPVVISWLVWAINNVTIFAAMWIGGEFSWYMAAVAINCCLIFTLSLKKGKLELNWISVTCGIISIAGIVLGVLYRSPILSLVCSGIVSLASAVPTIQSMAKVPEDENRLAWVINYVSLWCGTIVIEHWSLTTGIIPVVWLSIGTTFQYLLWRPRRQKKE